MTTNLNNFYPQSVWAHFAALCAIPRASLHEAALIQHLIEWAKTRGIAACVDGAGNLILRKPASPGCEAQPGVILQGHLDMVCQANSQANAGTQHDFERDPINAVVRDGWVVAENTTLGADNGIGVALALAALEATDWVHPPLEVLLTVNEESGMDGARGLAAGTLQGRTLINLDTEEWGHFYLGCAGGVDVEVSNLREKEKGAAQVFTPTLPLHGGGEAVAVPSDYALLRFAVSGLRGGHSGIDIHLGRGNAIKLLVEALRDLSAHTELHLLEMRGGTARNALPREAFAVCALPAEVAANIDEWVLHRHEALRKCWAETDKGVTFTVRYLSSARVQDGREEVPSDMNVSAHSAQGGGNTYRVISPEAQARVLAFLDSAAYGVSRMSEDFAGVVDTSDNLGVVSLVQGEFRANFNVRSLHDGRRDALADKLMSHAECYGLRAVKGIAYPGWLPNPSSRLLALCQQVYTAQYGEPAGLQVIHAGLECGLLAASHPQLDMISFGPDIRGAHAPGERVEIASVGRCQEFLRAVLQTLGKAENLP